MLTARQQRIKDLVAQPYGDLVHEGQLLDPVCRDIEALLLSSQQRVTGDVHVLLSPGNLFVEGVESPYSLMAASKGVYGEAAGRMDGQRCARLLEDRLADGRVLHPRRRAGRARRGQEAVKMAEMRSVVVDKIASVTQACGLSHEVRVAAEIPAEEGVVVVVEVLTNKSTYNTLELTSGRMAKVGKGDIVAGRARAPQGAVRLLRPRAREGQARRHHPDAQHRRRAGHLRLGQPRQGQAVRLPRARRCAHLPLPRRAHRRAGARRRQAPRPGRAPRHRGRAGGGAGRHLHGGRQDRRGLRDRSRACAIAA